MKRQAYLDLMEKHQKELSDFPMEYAFNEEQLSRALDKLGATVKECVTVTGYGDVIKKTDVPAFFELLKQQREELFTALQDKEFAEAAFLYEMDNHEYAINWDGDADVLACFNLDEKKLYEMGLDGAYRRARKAHYDHAREWEMI